MYIVKTAENDRLPHYCVTLCTVTLVPRNSCEPDQTACELREVTHWTHDVVARFNQRQLIQLRNMNMLSLDDSIRRDGNRRIRGNMATPHRLFKIIVVS